MEEEHDLLIVHAMNQYHIAEHRGGPALKDYQHYGSTKEAREENYRKEIESTVSNYQVNTRLARCELLMGLAKEAAKKAQTLINDASKWSLAHYDVDRGLKLSEISTEDGEYILRAEGEIAAPADMVVKMNLQNDPIPRKRWDHDLVDIRLVEMLKEGALWVLDSEVSFGIPLVWNRRYVGLQWYAKAKNGDHYLVTRSIPEHLRNHDKLCERPNTVDAHGFSGLLVKPHKKNAYRCHVTLVAHIRPGGYIPDSLVAWGKMAMLDRLALFEKAYEQVLVE